MSTNLSFALTGAFFIVAGVVVILTRKRYYAYRRRADTKFWRFFGLEPKPGYFRTYVVSTWAVAVAFVLFGALFLWLGLSFAKS